MVNQTPKTKELEQLLIKLDYHDVDDERVSRTVKLARKIASSLKNPIKRAVYLDCISIFESEYPKIGHCPN